MSGCAEHWRALAIAGALFLGLSAPTLAQTGSDYERGVAARLAGHTDEALELLARAAAAEPRNADAQLQYGLALLAAGLLDDAERAFGTTLELAPNYDDARIALARVHQRRGDREAALAELNRVSPTNPEASELRAALMRATADSSYRWQVDLDGSYSDVRGQQDWHDLSLRLTHVVSPFTRIGAAMETSRRFGEHDTYGEIRIDHRASDRTNFWLFAGATPSADFRPRWQVGAGGALKLTQGPAATVATVDARHSLYRSGDIQMLNPGFEQYIPGGHWITGRMINVIEGGNRHTGWLARADVMASSRLRLFAGAAHAPDINEGVVVDTVSLFGGLAVALNDRTTLRLFVNSEDRKGSSDRFEFGTGMGLRF